MLLKTLIILIFYSIQCTKSANILYITPFTSTSHHILLSPLGLELARRGHYVTVITAYKAKDPPANYREIVTEDTKIWDILKTERPNIFTMVDLSAEDFHHKILWTGGLAYTESALNTTSVQDFLKENNTFDLVISEQFFQEAFYALSYKYKAPLALITTFGNCMRHNIVTRNPLQLSTVIEEFVDIKDPTSFYGRLRNLYFTAYEYIIWKFWYLKEQEKLVSKYLPDIADSVPSLYDLQKNTSIMLINGHFSYETAHALLPNIVEVGGLHLNKSHTKLPQDLQQYLDNSKYGVIYINFGSNVRSAELSDDKKNAFLNALKRFKQNVLWKWEEDKMANKPNNVMIRKWLPQKEILAHPNVKVFVSHGGLIGTQEAIFNGVPIIGVPIYADQYNNLLLAKNEGYGTILLFRDINEENLYNTLYTFLNDDKIMKKAKEMSIRFQDRPMTPLDTAIYWLEYVIRNKGADYMKNPARNLSWVSYYMIDIYIFVAIWIIVITYLLILVSKLFIRYVTFVKQKVE